MVKEKNFVPVVVAADNGEIISSANTKLEGNAFSSVYDASLLTKNVTVTARAKHSMLVVSSPIMGFNIRLATLVISYTTKIHLLY